MEGLTEDYAACAAVLAESRSSFALPIRLLPVAKRRSMIALYAFCRMADDIVDGPHVGAQSSDAAVRLASFRRALGAALDGEACDEPVLRALADTTWRHAIPRRHLYAVLDGVGQDLDERGVDDGWAGAFMHVDDLLAYCRRVASAVGQAAIHIWGFRSDAALAPADACGLAFQMTNILRDLAEDLGRGRIYVPHDDFVACGCKIEDLRRGRVGPEFTKLAAIQFARTEGFFREAASLDPLLSTDGRVMFRAMYGVYRAIFNAVQRSGREIFLRRPTVARARLLASAGATIAVGPRAVCRGVGMVGRQVVPVAEASQDRRPRSTKAVRENVSWTTSDSLPVLVVGGGLAGLAATVALVDAGLGGPDVPLHLLEARRRVGGRAASFEDRHGGGFVDACQHVAMGCCTNFLDLCRRTGIGDGLRRDTAFWFIGPDGRRGCCRPSVWLPPPFHLAPLLKAMPHLGLGDKAALSLGMLRLARFRGDDGRPPTAAAWLRSIGQPSRVVNLFWQPVLESALGESLSLVSVDAAKKVLVDGFLAHRNAADLYVPTMPLGELFGERLSRWLTNRGVAIETGRDVIGIERGADGDVVAAIVGRRQGVSDGGDSVRIPCRACILAVPWRAAGRLVPDVVPAADEALTGSPITAVHLWFDRPVVDLPHAVLLGRLSQWVFRPHDDGSPHSRGYCQVVISGSHSLVGADRQRLLADVVNDLRSIFPQACEATLLDAKIVTDPTAVLSVRPGVDAVRPMAVTDVPGLFLAGDWTGTGWPSTMEGAVRSGRLAAAACLESLGLPSFELTPDLPRAALVKLLARSTRAETGGRFRQSVEPRSSRRRPI